MIHENLSETRWRTGVEHYQPNTNPPGMKLPQQSSISVPKPRHAWGISTVSLRGRGHWLGTARNERRATLRIRVVVFPVYPISHLMLILTREWEDIIIQMYCAYLMEVTSAPVPFRLKLCA